jgi:small neutral amino acid transporter SnatA (MarC family)
VLKEGSLIAIKRLMGMPLGRLSVQMFLDGIARYFSNRK